jgi:hypothetical protein
MRAAGDATALALRKKYTVQMPNLTLNDNEVAAVIDYIDRQSHAFARAVAGAPAPASAPRREAESDLGPILTAYLTIQRALADDSLTGVKARAHDIAVEAARGGPAEQPVMAAANRFERVTDLSSARLAFGALSDAMLISAKRTRGSLDPGVKVAYCPMARKYWLQTGVTIENPYYGATMRTCGRFDAGIPSVE